MAELYKCGICGAVTKAGEQVCDVVAIEDKDEYCGTDDKPTVMCNTMRKQAAYMCNSCGRPADQPDHLCDPLKI